jgi:hypothetical protein
MTAPTSPAMIVPAVTANEGVLDKAKEEVDEAIDKSRDALRRT